jgi:predicted nucleic acid-binding protein
VEVLRTGRSLNLGGNVHDLLIAITCRDHGLPLATLDRRQSTLAAGLAGLDSTLLLSTG